MTTTHVYDAVIVGAGGAGLRAAIEASDSVRTAVISKLYPTGNMPDCMETILAAGMDVPASVHEAKWRREQKTGKA